MTPGRLPILLPAVMLLVALRFADPPGSQGHEVAEAVVRRGPAAPVGTTSTLPDAHEAASTAEAVDVPGNAFSVRIVPSSLSTGQAAAAPAPAALAAPLPAPVALVPVAEPIPPLQVIGTYDDGRTTAVFIATPMGTLMARPGSLLLSEYQVAGITPGRVTLTRVSNQRSFELPVPAASRP